MYHLGVTKGFLFYPSSTTDYADEMKIKNTDSYIIKQPLQIPDGDMSFNDFCKLMYASENKFVNSVITK